MGKPVDLMEYQAKELFAKHGVKTTLGVVVETAEEAKAAAEKLGGVTVIKAQVKAGGRGKAGGVKLAKTADEAFEHASNILGMEIKGLTVNRVLVTPATPPVVAGAYTRGAVRGLIPFGVLIVVVVAWTGPAAGASRPASSAGVKRVGWPLPSRTQTARPCW